MRCRSHSFLQGATGFRAAVLVVLLMSLADVYAQDPLEGRFVKHEVRVEAVTPPNCVPQKTSTITTPFASVPVSFNCAGRSFTGTATLLVPDTPPRANPSEDGKTMILESGLTASLTSSITTTAPTDTEKDPYGLSLYSQVNQEAMVVCSDLKSEQMDPGQTRTIDLTLPCSGLTRLARAHPSTATYDGVFGSTAIYAVNNNEGPTVQAAVIFQTYYEFGDTTAISISPGVAPNVVRSGYFEEPLRVTILGSGFENGANVSLGDIVVSGVNVVSETSITADLSGFQDLPEGPRDVVITNPGGMELRGDDAFYVSSLALGPLEVNQSVPMPCNQQGRHCVANHDTVVRATIECNGAGCESGKESARAVLHVSKNGIPISGSPLAADPPTLKVRSLGTTATPDERRSMKDALNFYFGGADALGAGDYDFVLEINPKKPAEAPSGTSPDVVSNLTFVRSDQYFRSSLPEQRIRAAVIFDVTAERWKARLLPTAGAYFDYIRGAFPASREHLTFDLITDHFITFTTEAETMEALVDWYGMQKSLLTEPYTHLIMSSLAPSGDPGFAHCGSSGDTFMCMAPIVVIRSNIDNPETTLAHELSHTFLLGETYTVSGNEARSKLNPIYAECELLKDGCPAENYVVDLVRREQSVDLGSGHPSYKTFVKRDVMGNVARASRWIDQRTWDYFWGIFQEGRSPAARQASASGDWITVGGSVRSDNASAALSNLWTGSGTFDETSTPSGDYTIEIENASGATLRSKSFPLDFRPLHHRDQTRPSAAFTITMPLPSGASRVVLSYQGNELASRQISSAAPTVRVDAPNGGENVSGTTTIRWTGSDPDGDTLTYSIFYEPSQGRRIPIATGLSGTSLSWDASLAPGSDAARIRIVANDGFRNAADTSDGTFRVASGGPIVAINSPVDAAAIELGVPVTLRGSAFDFEDGMLPDSSLVFRSSLDGELGHGNSVTTQLSGGTHTITLSAIDSEGKQGTDSITVSVFEPTTELRIIPAVGSTPGDKGSFFKTAFQLHNPTTSAMAGRIIYHPAGTSGTANDPVLPYNLAPGATIYYPDLLPEIGQSGLGSADLVSTFGPPPLSVIRIFNDAGEAGTTGMTEEKLSPEVVLVEGDDTVLIMPPDPVRARTNIGIRTLDEGGAFWPTLVDKGGALKVGLGKQEYPPNYFTQFSAASLFEAHGYSIEGTDAILIKVASGRLVIYGATTDNTTQDPSLQFAFAQPKLGPTGEHKIIPVVGSQAGNLGSYFKTELQFHNAQQRSVDVRIDYRPQGSSSVTGSLEFEILNHRSHYIPDLLPAMGIESGIGTADIYVTSSVGGLPRTLVRIFNDGGEAGTTGMTEDPVSPDDALKPGQQGVLIAPPDPLGARFNIGVRALDQGVSMQITVRDAAGNTRTSLSRSWGPNAFEQNASSFLLGVDLQGNESISFTVNSGSAIVYGATTDNTTQDPSLQYAVPIL